MTANLKRNLNFLPVNIFQIFDTVYWNYRLLPPTPCSVTKMQLSGIIHLICFLRYGLAASEKEQPI